MPAQTPAKEETMLDKKKRPAHKAILHRLSAECKKVRPGGNRSETIAAIKTLLILLEGMIIPPKHLKQVLERVQALKQVVERYFSPDELNLFNTAIASLADDLEKATEDKADKETMRSGPSCPECGFKMISDGGTVICPNCRDEVINGGRWT